MIIIIIIDLRVSSDSDSYHTDTQLLPYIRVFLFKSDHRDAIATGQLKNSHKSQTLIIDTSQTVQKLAEVIKSFRRQKLTVW